MPLVVVADLFLVLLGIHQKQMLAKASIHNAEPFYGDIKVQAGSSATNLATGSSGDRIALGALPVNCRNRRLHQLCPSPSMAPGGVLSVIAI